MKKYVLAAVAAVMVLSSAALAGDAIMTKDGKTTVVNTTELTKGVRGFRGPVPVKLYIKSNKIMKVEPPAESGDSEVLRQGQDHSCQV